MTEAQAQAIEALRIRFLARCTGELERLRLHLAGEEFADGELRLLVHRLAGAAGTFGYPELSAVARDLDDRLIDGDLEPQQIRELVSAFEALPPPLGELG